MTTIPFRLALGHRLKELREKAHLQQDLLALVGRRWGLAWSANTVAQLETGRRHLTAEEWILLPALLSQALGGSYTYEDLMPEPSSNRIAVTKVTFAYPDDLRSIVQAHGVPSREWDTPYSRRKVALAQLDSRGRISRKEAVRDSVTDISVADYKASRVLGVSPADVVTAAHRLWRRSLMEERDHRLLLAGHEILTTRKAQALKGHVTRSLIRELSPKLKTLGKGYKKKRDS